MLKIHRTSLFKKDYKRAIKNGRQIELLQEVIITLINKKSLPLKNKDHSLSGNYADYRECHIQPNWLLIYKFNKDTLFLTRTGSHSDLF